MSETLDKDTRMWAMICHLSALAMLTGIPFANILGPLIVWQIKKKDLPQIDEYGKESLNFQIAMSIYTLILAVTICIGIGFFILPLILIANVVFVVIAGLKANNGEFYKYPLIFRLIK